MTQPRPRCARTQADPGSPPPNKDATSHDRRARPFSAPSWVVPDPLVPWLLHAGGAARATPSLASVPGAGRDAARRPGPHRPGSDEDPRRARPPLRWSDCRLDEVPPVHHSDGSGSTGVACARTEAGLLPAKPRWSSERPGTRRATPRGSPACTTSARSRIPGRGSAADQVTKPSSASPRLNMRARTGRPPRPGAARSRRPAPCRRPARPGRRQGHPAALGELGTVGSELDDGTLARERHQAADEQVSGPDQAESRGHRRQRRFAIARSGHGPRGLERAVPRHRRGGAASATDGARSRGRAGRRSSRAGSLDGPALSPARSRPGLQVRTRRLRPGGRPRRGVAELPVAGTYVP